MDRVFADTFYWVALANPVDPFHAEVVKRRAELVGVSLVTTDSVLTEFLTFFSGHPSLRARAGRTAAALLTDPNTVVLPESRQTFLFGLELYRARPDKGYSLTDCISMETMRHEKLTNVLTNDRHFEQEGFRALFRS